MSDERKQGEEPNKAMTPQEVQAEFAKGISALGVLNLQKAQIESDIEILTMRLMGIQEQLAAEMKKRASGLVVVPPAVVPPNPPTKK